MAHTWSPFQNAIFEEVASGGTANVVVLARAGSGKTTTVVEAMKHVPAGSRVLFCAFNKRIQQELASRIPQGVDAKTLHALGLRAVKKAYPYVQIDADAAVPHIQKAVLASYEKYVEDEVGYIPDLRDRLAREDVGAVTKLVAFAKNTLAATDHEVQALAADLDVWGGYLGTEELSEAALAVLEACKTPGESISFDDMVWLPVILKLPVATYDVVFVDEAQDLNACQIALIQMACKGRIVAVGDDRQAIYSFRGASQNAIPSLVDGIDAKTLPLSISYRCAQEIVKLAATIVPDIAPAPAAPVGVVRTTGMSDLLANATPGDFVLSRTNAAAVETCIQLLRKGVPATVVGRDIGKSICRLVAQATEKSRVNSLEGLIVWTRGWLDRTTKRAVKRAERLGRSPDNAVQSAQDRAGVLLEIAAASHSLDDLSRRLGSLFSDDDDRTPRVSCSTIHKAKGLEADRCWVLVDTWTRGGNEEENLRYVAYTRAKRELVLVRTPRR